MQKTDRTKDLRRFCAISKNKDNPLRGEELGRIRLLLPQGYLPIGYQSLLKKRQKYRAETELFGSVGVIRDSIAQFLGVSIAAHNCPAGQERKRTQLFREGDRRPSNRFVVRA